MPRIAIIALMTISISVVCLGAVAALGSNDDLGFAFFGGASCKTVPGAGPTRDIAWDGSDHAGLSLSATADYTPGVGDKLHISGDPQTIAHIRIEDGSIGMNCNSNFHRGAIHIVLPGRPFKSFHVSGSGDLSLHKLQQAALAIGISGSGSVKADGHVEKQEIHVSGSGDADFARVTGRIARVRVSGSGDVDVAPSDEAELHISGSGDVTLHSNPKKVESHVSGSGEIRNLGSGI